MYPAMEQISSVGEKQKTSDAVERKRTRGGADCLGYDGDLSRCEDL